MAYEAISNQLSTTSLYKPTPASELQSNLAHFYQRTSNFVDEQFEKMIEDSDEVIPTTTRRSQESHSDAPRLNPQGMGTLVDLYA